MMNKNYLSELKKAYKSADYVENEPSRIGIEIVEGSITGKISSLTECYIALEG